MGTSKRSPCCPCTCCSPRWCTSTRSSCKRVLDGGDLTLAGEDRRALSPLFWGAPAPTGERRVSTGRAAPSHSAGTFSGGRREPIHTQLHHTTRQHPLLRRGRRPGQRRAVLLAGLLRHRRRE